MLQVDSLRIAVVVIVVVVIITTHFITFGVFVVVGKLSFTTVTIENKHNIFFPTLGNISIYLS